MLIDELDPLFTEIAGLLGELEGNERCWSVLDSEETRPLQDGWMRDSGYFTIPGTYGFDTPALYVAMHPMHDDWETSEVTNADRQQLIQGLLTEVWEESRDAWSMGTVATVYRTASRDVWEPDPTKMTEAVSTLGDVTRWLADQLDAGRGWMSPDSADAPEWLVDLGQAWPPTSQSSQSFYAFWDDVNDKCGLYLHAAARLASSSAQVTAAISDFQTNLLEATGKARDQVRKALQQWQVWKDSSGAWPTGEMEDSDGPELLGGLSLALGVISLWGPAAAVAGPLSVVAGGASYLVDAQTIEMEATRAATASEIHNGFVSDLRTIRENLAQALDALRVETPADGSTFAHQGLESFTADVTANRRDWSPLPVNL